MPHTILQITTVVRPVDGECPDCHFDALRRISGFHLSLHGVTTVFEHVYCGRCRAEERREREHGRDST